MGARSELSGARLPQNRRRFLRGKRGCVGFWNVLKYTAQYIIRSILYYNILKYTEGPLLAGARAEVTLLVLFPISRFDL